MEDSECSFVRSLSEEHPQEEPGWGLLDRDLGPGLWPGLESETEGQKCNPDSRVVGENVWMMGT